MSKHVGPHVSITARREELVCTRCDYLKHNLIRSGRQPQWECLCLHPRAVEVAKRVSPHERVWSSNGRDGCWIGEDPLTPNWCPERKDNQADALPLTRKYKCRGCGYLVESSDGFCGECLCEEDGE